MKTQKRDKPEIEYTIYDDAEGFLDEAARGNHRVG